VIILDEHFPPRDESSPHAPRCWMRRLWDELVATPAGFVLYGGTAIALRLGHRQSRPNTLTCLVNRGGEVQVSFFGGLFWKQNVSYWFLLSPELLHPSCPTILHATVCQNIFIGANETHLDVQASASCPGVRLEWLAPRLPAPERSRCGNQEGGQG